MTRLPELDDIEAQTKAFDQYSEEAAANQNLKREGTLVDPTDELKDKKETTTRAWRGRNKEIYGTVDQRVIEEVVSRASGIALEVVRKRDAPSLARDPNPSVVTRSARAPLVFVSYSHKDKRHFERLRTFLKPKHRDGLIDAWDDTRIKPGELWRGEIEASLDSACLIIMLISADFIASEFINRVELPKLLTRHAERRLDVLTVYVGTCPDDPSLSKFQAVNSPKVPLNGMTRARRDEVWTRLVKRIDELVGSSSDTL